MGGRFANSLGREPGGGNLHSSKSRASPKAMITNKSNSTLPINLLYVPSQTTTPPLSLEPIILVNRPGKANRHIQRPRHSQTLVRRMQRRRR